MSGVNANHQGVFNPSGTIREPMNVPDQPALTNVELETGVAGVGGLLPGMTKEYSGWDIYNNEAKKVDTELVKDWTANLNSLLLFAAIFAAVLTAFIIESKKLLEVDPADVILAVMIFHTNNVANGTHTIYNQPDFTPSASAVTINCLLFASLSLSLVAALASVVALQWIGDYDAAITRGGSSAEDRAKRRQFRYDGVISWRMGGIIAFIPLLLYSSVVLFLAGLILWLWIVNQVVGIVIAGGAGIALLFYGGTTTLAVAFVSAPFRTPLGKWIYSILHLPFSLGFLVTLASRDSSLRAWLEARYGLWGQYQGTSFRMRRRTSIGAWFAYHMRFESILPWLQRRHINGSSPNRREDREVQRKEGLGLDALAWLTTQLSISQDSYNRLLLLISEIPKLSENHYFSAFDIGPWMGIFHFVSSKLLRKSIDEKITVDDVRTVSVLVRCYQVPKIRDCVSPMAGTRYFLNDRHDLYWRQQCGDFDLSYRSHQISSSQFPNYLFLLFRDIPIPSEGKVSEMEGAIYLSRWRNMKDKPPEIWCQVADFGLQYSSGFFDEYSKTLLRYLRIQSAIWWRKMAEYMQNKYRGPNRSHLLRVQASVLHDMRGGQFWYAALSRPSLLTHLQKVFEYSVPCSEHHDGDGHILLHLFDGLPSAEILIDMSSEVPIPMKGRSLNMLLMVWILPREYKQPALWQIHTSVNPQCSAQILGILHVVKTSQFSALSFLSDLCWHILRDDSSGTDICSEDVAAMSICAMQALDLPWDPRAATVIPELGRRILELKGRMLSNAIRSDEENAVASSVSYEMVNRLYIYAATKSVFGRQNRRLLSCAQAVDRAIPAVGWLGPHID